MPVRAGSAAPDFTLPGTGGRNYSLSEYRGKTVVLVFYPGDNTPVCAAGGYRNPATPAPYSSSL